MLHETRVSIDRLSQEPMLFEEVNVSSLLMKWMNACTTLVVAARPGALGFAARLAPTQRSFAFAALVDARRVVFSPDLARDEPREGRQVAGREGRDESRLAACRAGRLLAVICAALEPAAARAARARARVPHHEFRID